MKVIIPVAGSGTRLRPHTLTKPKVLLNVAGEPMIYHIVKQLMDDKIGTSVIFVTGIFGDKIEEYLKSTFPLNFEFVLQDNPKGLGHAIHCTKHLFDENEEVLIILGDTLFDADLKELCSSGYSCLGKKIVDEPKRFGVVETNDSGFVTKLVEKPSSPEVSPSKDAIVGLYYIKNSKILFSSLDFIIENNLKTKNEYQLTDALAKMLQEGEVFTTYNLQNWLDCGKKETILETSNFLLRKLNKKYNYKTCLIGYPVFIGENVTLENCIIGDNVTISSNCNISNSIIKNSIIDKHSTIENSVIENSLIGENSFIKHKVKELNLGEHSHILE